jgi:undecaprenyl-diphosphatase
LSPLAARLLGCAALAVVFVGFTGFVAAGGMAAADRQMLAAMNALWVPALRSPLRAFAVLGGLEITTLVALGLALYLWRAGFRTDVFALVVLPIGTVLEIAYKRLVFHPGVPLGISKGDGPSLSTVLETTGGNSYPSGHIIRSVIVYGLLAFVVYRLARRRWVRTAAVAAFLVLAVLMAFDRLYLEVHWESDVIGALLLGGVCLLAATLWLDRPHPV